MNDFLNGIFHIWQKLPQESKTAFADNLSMKEKSAVKIGKQLLEYYVDVSHDLKRREELMQMQQEEELRQKKENKKRKKNQNNDNPNPQATQQNYVGTPLEAFIKNIPPEMLHNVLGGIAQAMNMQNPQHPPQQNPQSTERKVKNVTPKDEDDDIIDAEWTEAPRKGQNK